MKSFSIKNYSKHKTYCKTIPLSREALHKNIVVLYLHILRVISLWWWHKTHKCARYIHFCTEKRGLLSVYKMRRSLYWADKKFMFCHRLLDYSIISPTVLIKIACSLLTLLVLAGSSFLGTHLKFRKYFLGVNPN